MDLVDLRWIPLRLDESARPRDVIITDVDVLILGGDVLAKVGTF